MPCPSNLTLPAFRRRAVQMFERANPGFKLVGWTWAARRITYPTGLKGLYGRFQASNGETIGEVVADFDSIHGLETRGFGPTRRIGAAA